MSLERLYHKPLAIVLMKLEMLNLGHSDLNQDYAFHYFAFFRIGT